MRRCGLWEVIVSWGWGLACSTREGHSQRVVGGGLSSPRICQHLDPGLPASAAVRSTFCCFQASQFMVLLLSQPKQTETVVLFLCISHGVPPNMHTHACVHTHTSVPVGQTSSTDQGQKARAEPGTVYPGRLHAPGKTQESRPQTTWSVLWPCDIPGGKTIS